MDFLSNSKFVGKKVAVVGAGYVGSSIAYALTVCGMAHEIILIDVDPVKAHGEAEDIQHGIPFMGVSSVRVGDYCDCADCDLIIITAGRNRRPGETRLKLIDDNCNIMRSVIDNIKRYYTGGVILLVSNPVDIMVHLCAQWMELPRGMVFGTGCLLDTSRLVRVVSDYVKLTPEVIHGFVAGEHGDSQVPIWSKMMIGNSTISEYCSSVGLEWTETQRSQIAERVKRMGADIIAAKGRTHFGIATCVCSLADAILNSHPILASVSSPLCGEYGIHNIALSVPSVIGSHGVERIIEEKWTNEEMTLFQMSAKQIEMTLKNVI